MAFWLFYRRVLFAASRITFNPNTLMVDLLLPLVAIVGINRTILHQNMNVTEGKIAAIGVLPL